MRRCPPDVRSFSPQSFNLSASFPANEARSASPAGRNDAERVGASLANPARPSIMRLILPFCLPIVVAVR